MAEVADVFRLYGPAYLKKFAHGIPQNHLKVMRDAELCRTESLGGEVYHCSKCNTQRYSYHSCGNRHCPKCQNDQAAHWLSVQEQKLLKVPYFLVTFTIPASLRSIARSNQKIVYNLLFKAANETLATLARDPRLLGGTLGFMSVLHTWTSQLIYHPHIHAVIPGGAMSLDHSKWLSTRGKEWFLPVRALSKMFRGKFLDGLKRAGLGQHLPQSVWKVPWIVHSKTAGSGTQVLKYLAPYVFRTAISNRRILKVENGMVTFSYKDRQANCQKVMTLKAEEFIRRFLQHVLPKGFRKVRYYGFLAQACKKKLEIVRKLTGAAPCSPGPSSSCDSSSPLGKLCCPNCGQTMDCIKSIPRRKRAPPRVYRINVVRQSA